MAQYNPLASSTLPNAAQNVASTSKSGLNSTPYANGPDLPGLQAAGRVVNDQLIRDAHFPPSFTDFLFSSGGHSSSTYTIYPGDYCVPYQKRRHLGIPPSLWEHFQSSKSICHMGVLPEIDRVWISLDHKLFLWDYVEGKDLSSFVEQTDIICHVALVKPKAGVFIDEISNILVICTITSILLIGVSTTAVGYNENRHIDIRLFATDMIIKTDGVQMTSVISTFDGRLFMCGDEDGNLYEFFYQEREVWFGKRFHLINHSVSGVANFLPVLSTPQSTERIISLVADQSNGYFFSLSDQSWISVWKLEPNKGVRKVQTITNLQKQAQDKAPGAVALTQPFKLLSVYVIGTHGTKSSNAYLMALSSTGVRLYFCALSHSQSYGVGSVYGSASVQLQLLHVRLPPSELYHPDEQSVQPRTVNFRGADASAPKRPLPLILNNLSISDYSGDLCLAAQPSDIDGRDFLMGISPDLTKLNTISQSSHAQPQSTFLQSGPYNNSASHMKSTLAEQATVLYVEGTIWAIGDLRRESAYRSTLGGVPVFNELATQYTEPRREFVIVTDAGISFLVKRRVIDYLRDALEEVQLDGNAQAIIDFRNNFGRDHTCAMLVALACGNIFVASEAALPSAEGKLSMSENETINLTKQAFFDLGERPIWVEGTFGSGNNNVIYSGRRQGLAIYSACLFRPFWKMNIVQTDRASGFVSGVSTSILEIAHRNIHSLRLFLAKNIQLFNTLPADSVSIRSVDEQKAWDVEQESISALLSLLSRTEEAISFVLLLIDYNVGETLALCDHDMKALASTITYEDLIATENGLAVSRALVDAIINRQIGLQISVDAMSDILQRRCGTFCSGEDVLLFKARENIRKAAETSQTQERQKFLADSLRLFMRAAQIIDLEKLRSICGDYQQLRYPKGAIELPLYCAHTVDTNGIGLEFWLAGCPDGDPRHDAFEKRLQCYDLVLDSLSVFDGGNVSSSSSLNEDIRDIYNLVFSADDPIFHSHLYDWFMGQGMVNILLETSPKYLEAHLQKEPHLVPNYELLWQLYVRNGQFLRAAEVLLALAQSTEFDVSLKARVEYLTLAVGNAKSHPFSASISEKQETALSFLSELEDLLEVAQVQLEIQNLLSNRLNDSNDLRQKYQLLQSGLFNITELYQLYAEPFGLSTIKLLILHVSEHRDDAVLQNIWNDIFSKALVENDPQKSASNLKNAIITNGRRFYPSQCSFPLRYVISLLTRYNLSNKGTLPLGWAPRILKEGNVPYHAIWGVFHEIYDSKVPPFNDHANMQVVFSDIAILIDDWLADLQHSESQVTQSGLPVNNLDDAIASYLQDNAALDRETRDKFENIRRQLRRYW